MLRVLILFYSPFVLALGSPDWRVREQAERRLRLSGAIAWPALLCADRSDPEISQRVDRILRPTHRHIEDVAAILFVCRAEPGWVRPEDCGWFCFGDRRLALDRLAARIQAYPSSCGSCWDCGYLCDQDQVAAVGNYLRSRAIGKPLPWSTPWYRCVCPEDEK